MVLIIFEYIYDGYGKNGRVIILYIFLEGRYKGKVVNYGFLGECFFLFIL